MLIRRRQDLRSIILAGPRDGTDSHAVRVALRTFPVAFNHIIVGSYRGTDAIVFHCAMEMELLCTIQPAQWNTGEWRGKIEGPWRNLAMLSCWEPIAVGAFPSPGPGTAGMIELSQRSGTPTYLYDLEQSLWLEI